ncbi:MAG: NADH-quinone oxidoreductase subunit F, partial [Clostridia bacterium]|nr:NADH-quinone oxidoreductase subunit F [Clostridia bacterium]
MSKTVSLITENYDKYNPASIDEYINIGGFTGLKNALNMTAEEIIEIATASKVLGRGGAAYPLGRKWLQAKSVPGDNKVVICNADEGEPCTFKDRSMLEKDPFRLIEGMAIAGYTVDAQNGYLYIREEYRHLQPQVKEAIKQAKEKGYLGNNILGTDFSYDIHVYSGAGAYVCGEGSALIESIEGKSGRPRIKPPFIKQCGLNLLPTCVNNVETLAIGTALLTHGVERYLSYGTNECPGTKIISVAGNVNNPGVYEIPFGITVKEI